MKLLHNKTLFLVSALAVITSCKKVITVTVNNATPVLVVQGNVTNQPGPYSVKLTSSVYYSEDNIFPAITSATVKITDDSTGIIDVLTEQQQGIYLTNTTVGAVNHTYHLYISAGGKEYTSTSTMPKQVFLDSITFLTNTGFGQNVTNPLPNFQDPVGIYNAYRFMEWYNSKPSKQIFVFDDRLSDGKYIARQLFNDSAYIQPGDTVQLEMQCIDKNVFNYFKELSGVDQTNGQPTSPANPTSNISNGALGYFSAHTVQRKTKVVTK